jgi:6-pyruvoyltetrahydropterin/6-carboxytetrahydropterin synthase
MTYYSTKTYGHNIGLACVFRQPNADHSHCHLLHGYSLAFKFTFGCKELDNKNWAVDFGGLKHLEKFKELEKLDLAEIRMFDGVGAEKFAEHAYRFADNLITVKTDGRCWVESVECMEHGANSAIYKRPE